MVYIDIETGVMFPLWFGVIKILRDIQLIPDLIVFEHSFIKIK
jgi:hypothetical protein